MTTRDGSSGDHRGPRCAATAGRRPLIVKELRGPLTGSLEWILRAARLALQSQREGNDVVVVVNAMSGKTDRLLALARQILPLPDARKLDAILATGEQVSVALIAMAIQAQGGQACSILGLQLPLVPDSASAQARVQGREQGLIREALAREQIAVVAGFQGADASRGLTTLGRGGPGTTAVALAAALGADQHEIHGDGDGVSTAEPSLAPPSGAESA